MSSKTSQNDVGAAQKKAEEAGTQEFRMDGPKKKSKSKKLKSFKQYLKEYCECSSIQGLNYMIKDISTFERIWWILVFLICILGCVFMIFEIYIKWNTSPVFVSFGTKEEPIYEIPFPAVTICPETKISKDRCIDYTNVLKRIKKSKQISPKEAKYFDYMSLMCKQANQRNAKERLDYFDEDFFDFLYTCESLNMTNSYCMWMGKKYDCNLLFKPILTDEGLCYTFNTFDAQDIYSDSVVKHMFEKRHNVSDWDIEEGYPSTVKEETFPKRALIAGAKNSLTVIFFTNISDIIHSCKEFSYQGVRVSLHMPSRIPIPSQVFFSVGLDRMVTAAVIPTVMTTSETVRKYHPHKRNCYLSKERHLRYFKIYSQNNCNAECFTNYTMKKCGCVNYYMPRENGTLICGATQRTCLASAQTQFPLDIYKKKMRARAEGSSTSIRQCDCLPICVDLNYDVELSNGVWDWQSQIKENEVGSNKNLLNLVKTHRASTVRVFFKSGFYIPLERNELYGPSDFISNFGGILGLFTGFSLFSVAEIIYFLSIKLIENYRHYGYWAGEPIS